MSDRGRLAFSMYVRRLDALYEQGTRVRIPVTESEDGARGFIEGVDCSGSVVICLEDGRRTRRIPDIEKFEILPRARKGKSVNASVEFQQNTMPEKLPEQGFLYQKD